MIKYNIKLNQGNEVLNSEKSISAVEVVENVDAKFMAHRTAADPAAPADPTSGNQGNNPNPGSGDDGMS